VDIVLLIGLIALNGLFAMAEIALVTARRNRLQRRAEAGDKAAALAIKLGEDPTRFLSTVQIGITAIGVLNGIVGEEAFAQPLSMHLVALGLQPDTSEATATAIVVVIITYLTIVLGELVPKRIGQNSAERIARIMARPISLLATITRPFVMLLTFSTHTILSLLGKTKSNGNDITEEDIHAILDEGTERGVIEQHEQVMMRKVLHLEDRPITTLMTPRSEIVFLDTTLSTDENLQRALASTHTTFPVCEGNLDQVLGIVESKQLFALHMQGKITEFAADLQPGTFVPESMTGMKLLEQFRQGGERMVFIVNEYGEVVGLVTLQNVLEALVGEFHAPADPQDSWAVQREDGSWLLDGLIPIPELKERLNLKSVAEEGKGNYNTLSGMMLLLLGNMPTTGAICEWEDWKLEVVDMDGNRLDKVLARKIEVVDDSG
jgi:putative hemolysin